MADAPTRAAAPDNPRDPVTDRLPAIVPLRFWTVFKPDSERPSAYLEEDWVEWVKKGEMAGATTQEAISRLRPRGDGRSAVEWTVIGPAYEAWKAGQALPESGTPLDAWPGCPRPLAEALKAAHVKSVEDFATLPDHHCDRVRFPGVRAFRTRAQAYVHALEIANVADELTSRDRTIAAQAGELAALREEMAELQRRVDALRETKPDTRPETKPEAKAAANGSGATHATPPRRKG